MRQADSSALTPAQYLGRWMAFQHQQYGHEFLFSTMLDYQICQCLGLQTYFLPDGSEHVSENQIKSIGDLHKINKPAPQDYPVAQAYISCIEEGKKLCAAPVGGACFGPFTCAGSVLGTEALCLACIKEPALIEKTVEITTEFILKMALACQEAGADFFWIAEPTGALVSPQHFHEYCGKYLRQIFDRLAIPGFLHIPGHTNHLIDEMIKTNAQCLSLDSFVDLRGLLQELPWEIILMGNINSLSLLYEPVKKVSRDIEKLNREIKNFPNVIVSSGGGLSTDIPEANLRALFTVTDKMPVWDNKQYLQIHRLWHILANQSFADMRLALTKERYAPEIIAASIEEACDFLGRNYRLKRLSRLDYSLQAQEILKLLNTDYLDKKCRIQLEGRALTLEQLKADIDPMSPEFTS